MSSENTSEIQPQATAALSDQDHISEGHSPCALPTTGAPYDQDQISEGQPPSNFPAKDTAAALNDQDPFSEGSPPSAVPITDALNDQDHTNEGQPPSSFSTNNTTATLSEQDHINEGQPPGAFSATSALSDQDHINAGQPPSNFSANETRAALSHQDHTSEEQPPSVFPATGALSDQDHITDKQPSSAFPETGALSDQDHISEDQPLGDFSSEKKTDAQNSQDHTNSNDMEIEDNASNSSSIGTPQFRHQTSSANNSSHLSVPTVNPTANEDSNVDVETEEQSTSLSKLSLQDVESQGLLSKVVAACNGMDECRNEQENNSDLSDPHYIEKKVVESFLYEKSNNTHTGDARKGLEITKGLSFSTNGGSYYELSSRREGFLSSAGDGFRTGSSNNVNSSKGEKVLDAVSLTIASVAAGQGETHKITGRDRNGREEYASQEQCHQSASKHKRNTPASVRLPVISSLLAPSSTGAYTQNLPSIQHIASRVRNIGDSRTVLPSVAHFLGPAKSPPINYTSHKSSTETYGAGLSQLSNDTSTPTSLGVHYPTSFEAHTKPSQIQATKSKSNQKIVTSAGLRLSMAASEELPDPLPVPQYSEKVIRAKQLGTVSFDRPTVLRETVQFFLQYKLYWSSHDYDRISNLVIELFPEFKDNGDAQGAPINKRIRADLSMYARNFRRREVSQRKKESPSNQGSSSLDHKSEAVTESASDYGGKPLLCSSSLSNPGSGVTSYGSATNPSDFCNELLTAASIIESQNTTGLGRNRDVNIGTTQNHKMQATESQIHDRVSLVNQKYEPREDGDRLKGSNNDQYGSQDGRAEDNEESPIHFVYDKNPVSTTASRDSSTAWQMYSEQVAQAVTGGNSGLDYETADQAIKKDLGTCARNMRRRLPNVSYKSVPLSWNNLHPGYELQTSNSSGTSVTQGTAEYMKALVAAQTMNLTELSITQRNLGELAMLAGIKQRIEQHPQDSSGIDRQYLVQGLSEEQRQALIASGTYSGDPAMAALSAFYGLGVDMMSFKRGQVPSDFMSTPTFDSSTVSGEIDPPSKRQRRASQTDLEGQLHNAEPNNSGIHSEERTHGISVGLSDKRLVKKEPISPSGESRRSSSGSHHHHQVSVQNMFPSGSVSSVHEPAHWDVQAASSMAYMTLPAAQQVTTRAHSQTHTHHDISTISEAPMNLTYNDSDRHVPHKLSADSPQPESLSDAAGLSTHVEVKSQSPRRRASSSSLWSQQHGNHSVSSRDQAKQAWTSPDAGLNKESQEIVNLPEPLPIPNYSQKVLSVRDEGTSVKHRSEIIRETARFFLGLKYWWSSADYTRISELVVQQFPDLRDGTCPDGMSCYRRIQRDLSMCARNLRRSKKPRKMKDPTSGLEGAFLESPDMPRSSKKQTRTLKSPSALSSNTEKKSKKLPGPSLKAKKPKQETDAEMSEEMAAATTLLQHQLMQSSEASAYYPSAHLLPSSHLLPSLHTHPELHNQLQDDDDHHQELEEEHNLRVEEANNVKRLVKQESGHQKQMDQSHAGEKSNIIASDRLTAVTEDDSLSKTDYSHLREVGGAAFNEDNQGKVTQSQNSANIYMKVYTDPDHGSDLRERFSFLWRKGKFFDASLGVANKKLHVHKLILLAMSPYLQETFKNADPRSQLEVNLPSDTTYETATAFLKYIYEGILEVDTSSVRSLHKIATMLQMTKLAQYCQDFAQHLQEEADRAGRVESGQEGEAPRLSVHLGEVQAHRRKQMEAQVLQHLGETTEEHGQLKGEYLTTEDHTTHLFHSDIQEQHHALLAASSSLQTSSSPQEVIQTGRHQPSSLHHSTSMYHHHQQHHQNMMAQSNASTALLHRLTSPDSSVIASGAASLDHQQRLALAAYWEELISHNQVTGLTTDPSTLALTSDMAAAGAATTSVEENHNLFSNLSHGTKLKMSHPGSHHSKERTWSSQGLDSNNTESHATLLPETCTPADMARTRVNSSE